MPQKRRYVSAFIVAAAFPFSVRPVPIYTVFQKHATTFSTASWTRTYCSFSTIFGTLIKLPLSTARAASCICSSVCLLVCLSVAKTQNAIFSNTKQFRGCYGVYCRPIESRTWAFQRTHYWTAKIKDGGDPPCWMLRPKCKNMIFSKLSNLEQWCLLTT